MIEPTRQEILTRLTHLSELAPDVRFGQLIANLALIGTGKPWDEALWDLDDGPLLEAIRKLEADLNRRAAEVA